MSNGTTQGSTASPDSGNDLVIKIMVSVITLAVLGVLGWTVKVTNANELAIVEVKAQIQQQATVNTMRFEGITTQLTTAVNEISNVAGSMRDIADSMYSAKEADEFIKKSESEVKNLQEKTTDLNWRVKNLEKRQPTS